jgi:hypothetical protein
MRRSGRTLEDRVTIQQELQSSLAKPVTEAHLAYEIATLLESAGTKINRRVLAQRLAEAFGSRFTYKSNQLQTIIKYRPEELSALAHTATWDQINTEVLPMIERQKKSRAKIKTEEERLRRVKQAKNRYEFVQRNRVVRPGYIEDEFADSRSLGGPCLDKIFHGGRTQMSGLGDSLQNLFGLGRKRLAMAKPRIQRGRETFYNFRGVLACMDALLKQSPENAYWLPDASRRRTVLIGILVRARQEATPKIRKTFEATLLPYLV